VYPAAMKAEENINTDYHNDSDNDDDNTPASSPTNHLNPDKSNYISESRTVLLLRFFLFCTVLDRLFAGGSSAGGLFSGNSICYNQYNKK
jgi:hypothetical protein